MKKKLLLVLLTMAHCISFCTLAKEEPGQLNPLFNENKGQLKDQHDQPRKDILFYGNTDGMTFYLKKMGVSYQLYTPGKGNDIAVSRVDMTWLDANPLVEISTENRSGACENFYNAVSGVPVTGAYSFGGLRYTDIYKGIDLHYYKSGSALKYDFIVRPGADYRSIRTRIEGAVNAAINEKGDLVITTRDGRITEARPVVLQGNRKINASWRLREGVLSFELGKYDPGQTLVIDPLVYQWYIHVPIPSGNTQPSIDYHKNQNDAYGNIYYVSNEDVDGFTRNSLVKTTGNGATIWTKSVFNISLLGRMYMRDLSVANNGIYVCGTTQSSGLVATSGAYQTTIVGGYDGFLMKADSGSNILWLTYYGGSANDGIEGCRSDAAGDVYLCGYTSSANNMSSASSYKPSPAGGVDGFIAKFSGAGTRVWSSYYGGSNTDSAKSIAISGNRIFIAGSTQSATGIAYGSAHQASLSGNTNGFLLCMDTTGMPQWSTYYGGDSTTGEYCRVNGSYLYFAGSTTALSGIATTGSFQAANAGLSDGFLAKFNFNGVRQWGTYYGGPGNDYLQGGTVGMAGHLFLSGVTNSVSGIATPNSYNPAFTASPYTTSSPRSAFLVELDTNGQRVEGTYISAALYATGCSANSNGSIVVSGTVTGPFRYEPYIMKFNYCNAYTPVVTASSNSICANDSAQLSTPAVAGSNYQWYRNNVAITGATGNAYQATQAGDYKVIVDQCSNGISATVTINTKPVPVTQITKSDAACATAAIGSITVTASGGTAPYAYAWDNSAVTSSTLSGLIPGTYVVHTTDAAFCHKTDTVTILNTNNIPVNQVSHTSVPCYGAPVATITLVTTGGASPYAYAWDNLANTTADLSGLGTGTYIAHTTDANNCSITDTIIVTQDTTIAPSDPLASICAVTADLATGKNTVLWQKTGIVKAIAYNIYRETSVAGQYELIGTRPVSETAVYTDAGSVPEQQSYRYRIAEVDSCNHEWPQSDPHTTIHLNANVGINGNVNLDWNAYEGKPYATHNIMRSTDGSAFILIGQVSSSVLAFSDLTPPAGTNVYRIEIDLGAACDASGGNQTVISNKMTITASTGIHGSIASSAIQLIPNPTAGILYIKGSVPGTISLYDATGRLMLKEKNKDKLDLSGFAKGIYTIRLQDEHGNMYCNQKVVVQ